MLNEDFRPKPEVVHLGLNVWYAVPVQPINDILVALNELSELS
jgi:hypothetical protein